METSNLSARAAAAEFQVARDTLIVLQKQQADPDYLVWAYDARIASIKAELSALLQEANRTNIYAIYAPVAGRVLKIWQKSAQFVTDGTPLLEIGDPAKLELVIDVRSTDALKIKPGVPIIIELGSGVTLMRAKVRLIEPAAFTKVSALGVEEQRVNVIGDFVTTPQGVGDAYRIKTQIVIWHNSHVLKAPLSALYCCNQAAWCVFTVKTKKANRQMITIGQRSNTAVEVTQGLQLGDRVILHPTE